MSLVRQKQDVLAIVRYFAVLFRKRSYQAGLLFFTIPLRIACRPHINGCVSPVDPSAVAYFSKLLEAWCLSVPCEFKITGHMEKNGHFGTKCYFSYETFVMELCFALKQSDNGFTASTMLIWIMVPTLLEFGSLDPWAKSK